MNLALLSKFRMKMRCFLEKFTQLAQILHDCRSRRSWQISTLARSCFMSFYLRSDLGDQFRVHVRWRLGLWWWQSTTDSPHLVSSGAEKKTIARCADFFLVDCCVFTIPPTAWALKRCLEIWGCWTRSTFHFSIILEEIVNRYKTRLLRFVGFRRTSHLLEATLPRWSTPRTHSGYIK